MVVKAKKAKEEVKEPVKPILQGDVVRQKIVDCKSIEELEEMNAEVIKVFGEDVPEDVQALAADKYKSLKEGAENEVFKKRITPESDPEAWKKLTPDEVKTAEKEGRLIGYNPKTGFALVK